MNLLLIDGDGVKTIPVGVTKEETRTYDFMIGNAYFIRTVTYHMVGKVVKTIGDLVEIDKASWVADSGRFQQAIDQGELNEVEPVGVKCWINMSAVTDFFEWKHSLELKQK